MQCGKRLILENPRFPLGKVAITPGALATLEELGKSPQEYLQRHASCDWADMSVDDASANIFAMLNGTRIFSSFNMHQGDKIWIITEADRSVTTLLLPDEY